jgi:osmotically-inducible protein OsmY
MTGHAGLAAVATAAPTGEEHLRSALASLPLADKVRAALAADTHLRDSAIGVKEKGGVVTLYGTADTAANRDRAARIAYAVEGTRYVKSNLLITSAR